MHLRTVSRGIASAIAVVLMITQLYLLCLLFLLLSTSALLSMIYSDGYVQGISILLIQRPGSSAEYVLHLLQVTIKNKVIAKHIRYHIIINIAIDIRYITFRFECP